MDFNRCTRCGSFYVSEDDVCPKCTTKDGFEFSNFIQYVEENGFENSLETISGETGIALKHLTRYANTEKFKNIQEKLDNLNTEEITLDI